MRVAFFNTLIYTKVACKPVSIAFANTVNRINAEPDVTVEQEINVEPDVIVTPYTPGDVLSLKLDRLIKVVTADVTSLTVGVYTQSEECPFTYVIMIGQSTLLCLRFPAIFHFLKSIKEKMK